MTSILHMSDPHFEFETMARLSDLANGHSEWDVVALTGDCGRVLPGHWNDWPQLLKLSVPGNHDLPETFVHLTNWIHKTPWFRRYGNLAFLGLDTSDKDNPFGTLNHQLYPFWDEDITGVSAFVVLTHKWPLDHEVNGAGQSLAKFINRRQLLILDGHNHPRGTRWEPNANIGGIACFRSTVISCDALKGTCHLITWNGKFFDCEDVRGEYERRQPVVMSGAAVHFGTEPSAKKSKLNTPWIECKCGMSEKRSNRFCRYCGKPLRYC